MFSSCENSKKENTSFHDAIKQNLIPIAENLFFCTTYKNLSDNISFNFIDNIENDKCYGTVELISNIESKEGEIKYICILEFEYNKKESVPLKYKVKNLICNIYDIENNAKKKVYESELHDLKDWENEIDKTYFYHHKDIQNKIKSAISNLNEAKYEYSNALNKIASSREEFMKESYDVSLKLKIEAYKLFVRSSLLIDEAQDYYNGANLMKNKILRNIP